MKRLSAIIRWISRLLGLFVIVMVIVFAIREGLTDPSRLTAAEQGMFIGTIMMFLGALAAWKWQVIGPMCIFVGFGVLWFAGNRYPGNYFDLFPLAGCLHLIAWLLDHKPVSAPATELNSDAHRGNKREHKAKA